MHIVFTCIYNESLNRDSGNASRLTHSVSLVVQQLETDMQHTSVERGTEGTKGPKERIHSHSQCKYEKKTNEKLGSCSREIGHTGNSQR